MFQRFMDEILRGFDFCFAYIDDILMYSCSPQEHKQHLRTLFKLLQAYGILLNPGKCVFRATEVTFLGYRSSGKGLQPLPDRVADLQACPPPQTTHHLRRFLGMLNFYRHFLPHTAATQAPLHALFTSPRMKGS
jgi:cleavage and polyadenylation specificity factor subunit 1